MGRSLRRLVLNFIGFFGDVGASWLVSRFPDLEVLHLLSSFRLVGDEGKATYWCHDLDYEYVEIGREQDVVGDDALGVLASSLRLKELVVSACVEADSFSDLDDTDDSAREQTAVTASPSIEAIGPALTALAPSLQRFGLASCASMGPLVSAFPPLPNLTGLRLDWSTADAEFREVQLLPAVTALARAGHLPRLTDLTLCLPWNVDSGARRAVTEFNSLTSLRRLRLVGAPHNDKDAWVTTVLATVALPLLTELVVEVTGSATLDASVPALRRRCPSLSSLRIHNATVGLALLQGLSIAGVPSAFVRCQVLPGVTHGWVRHDPLLRFLP